MRILVVFLAFFAFSLQTLAQSEAPAVKASIERFFEGMKANDSTLIKSVIHASCTLRSVSAGKDGETILLEEKMASFIKAVGTRREGISLDERITSYDIKTDGDMAMAWTPYRFYVNNQFRHCGVNVFSLMKTGGIWKIVSIIDTRRKDNCD